MCVHEGPPTPPKFLAEEHRVSTNLTVVADGHRTGNESFESGSPWTPDGIRKKPANLGHCVSEDTELLGGDDGVNAGVSF
jgi:hypothetical protein